jgi:hypothetical protein
MICKRWLEVSAVDLKAGVCWTAAGQALTLLCVGLNFVAYLGFLASKNCAEEGTKLGS